MTGTKVKCVSYFSRDNFHSLFSYECGTRDDLEPEATGFSLSSQVIVQKCGL